jgi:predicted ArsR family transcriptional regulator
LGDRVSIQATQARRFLEVLISAGALEVLTKGESYQKGKRPQATLYRWLVD